MGGMTIKRREARQRKLLEAMQSMPKQLSKEQREIWLKMTPKQRALATALSQSGTRRIDAFRLAYQVDENDTRPTVYRQSFHAVNNGKVKAITEALIGAFDANGLSNPVQTREFVLGKLSSLAQDDNVPAAVQANAAVWLGKSNHVRLFTEEKVAPEPIEDVEASLAEAMKELFAAQATILDVSSTSDSPSEPEVVEPKDP